MMVKSTPRQDELQFYATMIPTSAAPSDKHAWAFARAKWNSREPLTCQLANNYSLWVLFCKRNSVKPGDIWAKHLGWLLKATTYLRILMLADVLTMCKFAWCEQPLVDPARAGASDDEFSMRQVSARVTHYCLNEQQAPTPGEEAAGNHPGANILRRAICKFDLGKLSWYFQRGLRDIGYRKNKHLRDVTLSIRDDEGAKIKIAFTKTDFRDSYQWVQTLCTNFRASLDAGFQEEEVWKGLQRFTFPDIWRSGSVPATELRNIAQGINVAREELEKEWTQMARVVSAKLGPGPPHGDMEAKDFTTGVLLPALAAVEHCMLRQLIVTAVLTGGNCAQMERDMKSFREIWRKRTKKLDAHKLGLQCRLHLNEQARVNLRGSSSQMQRLWAMVWSIFATQRNAETQHAETGSKRRYSSPAPRSKAKQRRLASHLTPQDNDDIQEGLER